jgi:hypothetical protein
LQPPHVQNHTQLQEQCRRLSLSRHTHVAEFSVNADREQILLGNLAVACGTGHSPIRLGRVYLEFSDLEEEVGAVLLERPCHLHLRSLRMVCQRRR